MTRNISESPAVSHVREESTQPNLVVSREAGPAAGTRPHHAMAPRAAAAEGRSFATSTSTYR
jgi:hypothetical protein